MLKALAHRLLRVKTETVVMVFLFWLLQVVAWPVVMAVAVFDPRPFVNSLLFTVEVSLWALELAAGIGVTGAWAVLHSKRNTAKLDDIHADVQVVQEMEEAADETEKEEEGMETEKEEEGMGTKGHWT